MIDESLIESILILRQVSKSYDQMEEGQISDYGYFVLKGCIRCYYNIDGEENTTALSQHHFPKNS
jgi:hypothetical protein